MDIGRLGHAFRVPACSVEEDTTYTEEGLEPHSDSGHNYPDTTLSEVSHRTRGEVDEVTKEGDALVSQICLLYTSPSPRDQRGSRMPSSA